MNSISLSDPLACSNTTGLNLLIKRPKAIIIKKVFKFVIEY